MGTRNRKPEKREALSTDIYSTIERLKKARAVGCSPAYLGINTYVSSRLFSARAGSIARL